MRQCLSFLYGMVFIATHRLVFLRFYINYLVIFKSPAFGKIVIFNYLIIVDTQHISKIINRLALFCIDEFHLVILTNITFVRSLADNLCICDLIWNIFYSCWLLAFSFWLLAFGFWLLAALYLNLPFTTSWSYSVRL